MKQLLLILTVISVWVILKPTFAADVSFNVASATKTSYTKFLNDVRDLVKDEKLKYGGTNLPVMAAPKVPPEYLLVDLEAGEGVVISIALNKSNLYILGYLDKVAETYRAHFFSDIGSDANTTLFPEAKGVQNRINMGYTSSYYEITHAAGFSDRGKLSLGIQPLNKLIKLVYAKELVVKIEARLMLTAVQMISEAARFKYIENMILTTFTHFYNPDLKAKTLEVNWQTVSTKIMTSKNGIITPSLNLVDAKGKPWKVSLVKDIENDLGILKYEGNKV